MRPVAPRTGAPEVTFAENQTEYAPVTVAIHQDPGTGGRYLVTRWRLSADDRAKVLAGEDLFISQLNFGQGMTPLCIEMGDFWTARYAEQRRRQLEAYDDGA